MRLKVRSRRRVVKGDLRIEFVRQPVASYGGLDLLRHAVGYPLWLRVRSIDGEYRRTTETVKSSSVTPQRC